MTRTKIPRGSRISLVATNGAGNRQCRSWLDRFVQFTDNIEAPVIFRKWTAIGTIAAALQRRVWITTSDRLFPNLYIALVGHPGVGKSRTINKGRACLMDLEKHFFAPNDLTDAALLDALSSAQVAVQQMHPIYIDDHFNSMSMFFDEWGTLLKSYKDSSIIPILTTLYDCSVVYDQWRRTKDLKVKIEHPQVNIVGGTTPSNLMAYMPDIAWDQGFTSRLILVYSAEKNKRDHFDVITSDIPNDLLHDIELIHSMYGQFDVTPSYRDAVSEWRFEKDENPKPTHPKLAHYNARRTAHVYKLSMVAAADSSNDLRLTDEHFRTALGWLQDIEQLMPDIFKTGTLSFDARIMDEIEHFVASQGKPVTVHKIFRFASNLLPAYNIGKVVQIMQISGRLEQMGEDPVTFTVSKKD